MQITFDADAFDAFKRLVSELPDGYNLALLSDGQEVPNGELVPGVDVQFVRANDEGVVYREIDGAGEATDDTEHVRPWAHIARIHIY